MTTMKNRKKNNGSTKKRMYGISLAALLLVMCFNVAGISAYFTDVAEAENTFTIGKISLQLLEPGWTETQAQNIMAGQTITKDPQILNDGLNDEYVFLEVIVPYANVQVSDADGTRKDAADTELFTYEINDAEWVQVGDAAWDATAKTVTYVYAYAKDGNMTVLKKDAKTSALFEEVCLVDLVSGQGVEETTLSIKLNGYGVQTTNLFEEAEKVAPEDVWALVAADTAQ